MSRGRPRLPLGTYGEISVTAEPRKDGKPSYRAKARFRDADGVTRPVVRYGQTKGRARDSLKAALAERQRHASKGMVTSSSTVADLANLYLSTGDWSTNTLERYGLAIRKQINPLLGQVHIAELRRSGINAALTQIMAENGTGAATSAKTVLAGICKLAMKYDAIDANPVRDTVSVAGSQRDKEAVRALTRVEVEVLCDGLRTDPQAVEWDLPDLVEFMLGTGCRIGEACACRDAALDDTAGTWEINATVVRRKGVGLWVQPRPKSEAGWRVLALPPYVVDVIHRRRGELRFGRVEGVVFGSPRARALRDPSNTAGDLRRSLDALGFDWVTSHVFRKTVATRLDEAGWSARQIADHLGHAKPSMTMDVYMGRKVVNADAARVLDR